MSNQGWQQPPYNGPQMPSGGYPPPPPRRNKTGAVVGGVIGALVLIAGGLFVGSRFLGGSGSDDAVGTTEPVASQPVVPASSPTQPPPVGGSPTAPPVEPSAPVKPPAKGPCRGCFPGITVTSVLSQLKAKGFKCTEDRITGIDCEKGNLEVGLHRDYTLKKYVENADIGGRATGKGQFTQGPRQAFATLNAGIASVLPIFVGDAATRQQIIAFTARNAGHADNGPSTLVDGKAGGYRLSCHGISGITIGKGAKAVSTYSTAVNIYGPSAY